MVAGQDYRTRGWDIFHASNPGSKKHPQHWSEYEGFEYEIGHLLIPSNKRNQKCIRSSGRLGLVYLWA